MANAVDLLDRSVNKRSNADTMIQCKLNTRFTDAAECAVIIKMETTHFKVKAPQIRDHSRHDSSYFEFLHMPTKPYKIHTKIKTLVLKHTRNKICLLYLQLRAEVHM